MSDVTKIGLIGAGMVSEHHLAAWKTMGNARVTAIADPDIEAAATRAQNFGIANVYSSAEEMFICECLDAVDIVTPFKTHSELCLLAADYGLAVMCQKPLCENSSKAEALIARVGDRVRFKVHENWRFRPEYRRVRSIVNMGVLGKILRVDLDCSSSGLLIDAEGYYPALGRQPFFAYMQRLLVFELLIHHLDLLTWVFGPLHLTRAILSRNCRAVIGDDQAEIELKTEGGLPIRLTGSFCRASAPPIPTDELEIKAEGGFLRFSGELLELNGPLRVTEKYPFHNSYAASYQGAISDFVDGLQTVRPFETEAREHLAILRLVDKIYCEAKPL